MNKPQEFKDHIDWVMHSAILDIAYGHMSKAEGDPMIISSTGVLADFGDANTPGKWIVNAIPFLKWYPGWLPGGGFQNIAKKYKESMDGFSYRPYEPAKERFLKGQGGSCICTKLLEEYSEMEGGLTAEREEFIRYTLVSILGPGTGTNISSTQSFFLAMALFPEVQKRAQAEIDAVCSAPGSDPTRLPDFDDKESLPYIEAIIQEVFRWGVVTPLGFPHKATAPIEYKGFLIPEGTYLLSNIRGICEDPVRYKNPAEFRPERFMGPNPEMNPRETMFGYGRRECPGVNFSTSFLYALFACTLRCFDIAVIEGDVPKREFEGEIISHPKPFRCSIRLRDKVPLAELLSFELEY